VAGSGGGIELKKILQRRLIAIKNAAAIYCLDKGVSGQKPRDPT
jgi:hypothetical protein